MCLSRTWECDLMWGMWGKGLYRCNKDDLKARTFWVRMGPNSNGKSLHKRRRDNPAKMEAEIGMVLPQTREFLKPPEAGRNSERFSSEPSEGNPISYFWPPEL